MIIEREFPFAVRLCLNRKYHNTSYLQKHQTKLYYFSNKTITYADSQLYYFMQQP